MVVSIMRVDWFIADSGIAETPSDGLEAEVVERLTEDAEEFLRARGTLSWAEWQGLSRDSRRIFSDAGDRLRGELAGMIGAACADDGIASAMMTGSDLGNEAARRYCRAGLDVLEARLAQETRR